jgi:hypothetical protein
MEEKRGVIAQFLDKPQLAFFVGGLLLALAAVVSSVEYKDAKLVAAPDAWRNGLFGLAIFSMVAAVLAEFWERLVIGSRGRRKLPGPYTAATYPLRPRAPERVEVLDTVQTWQLQFTAAKPVPPGYEVALMHLDGRRLGPRGPVKEPKRDGNGELTWDIRLPVAKQSGKERDPTWRLAAYYIGPEARRLVEHHREVCKYFAPDGVPNWPPIANPPEDAVQCSPPIEVVFDYSRAPTQQRMTPPHGLSAIPLPTPEGRPGGTDTGVLGRGNPLPGGGPPRHGSGTTLPGS